MRANFWIKAWNEGNIGFHQSETHPALEKYWPALPPGASVLAPLCGKSLDLLWLEDRGLDVTGVEFFEPAVRQFFSENGLAAEESRQYGLKCYSARDRKIRIFAADFIEFAQVDDANRFDSLYDRAALVALPADMRPGYVEACKRLLVPDARGLLVTLEYDQSLMEGPPFSVEAVEVDRLWSRRMTRVEQMDMLSLMPRAKASGLSRLDEYFWLLQKAGAAAE
jgi:thiopurine S-methyltransferase